MPMYEVHRKADKDGMLDEIVCANSASEAKKIVMSRPAGAKLKLSDLDATRRPS